MFSKAGFSSLSPSGCEDRSEIQTFTVGFVGVKNAQKDALLDTINDKARGIDL